MSRFPLVALVALALVLPMGAPSGAAGVAAAVETTYADVHVELSDGVQRARDLLLALPRRGLASTRTSTSAARDGPRRAVHLFVSASRPTSTSSSNGSARSRGRTATWRCSAARTRPSPPCSARRSSRASLKAIVPIVADADADRDIVWHNGISNATVMARWLAAQTGLIDDRPRRRRLTCPPERRSASRSRPGSSRGTQGLCWERSGVHARRRHRSSHPPHRRLVRRVCARHACATPPGSPRRTTSSSCSPARTPAAAACSTRRTSTPTPAGRRACPPRRCSRGWTGSSRASATPIEHQPAAW